MAHIKEYWNDKEKRAEQAKKHTEEMEQKYKEKIKEVIENTIIYDTDFECSKAYSCETEISVEALVQRILNN